MFYDTIWLIIASLYSCRSSGGVPTTVRCYSVWREISPDSGQTISCTAVPSAATVPLGSVYSVDGENIRTCWITVSPCHPTSCSKGTHTSTALLLPWRRGVSQLQHPQNAAMMAVSQHRRRKPRQYNVLPLKAIHSALFRAHLNIQRETFHAVTNAPSPYIYTLC